MALRCPAVRGQSPSMFGADCGKYTVVIGLVNVVHPIASARMALCTMLYPVSEDRDKFNTCLLSLEAGCAFFHWLLEQQLVQFARVIAGVDWRHDLLFLRAR